MVFMGVQTLKAGAELTLLVVVIAVNYMFFNSNIMKAAEGAISKVAQIERDFNPIWAGADLIAGTKKARGSVTADCPPGYKNMGLYCANGPSSYAIGASTLADCPSGYTNMGTFCGRGFLKLGHTCDLGKCGTCPAGRFKGALNRCYLNCKAGYTNTGTYCGCFRVTTQRSQPTSVGVVTPTVLRAPKRPTRSGVTPASLLPPRIRHATPLATTPSTQLSRASPFCGRFQVVYQHW